MTPRSALLLLLFAFTWLRLSPCSAFEPPGAPEPGGRDRANTEIGKVYKQLMSRLTTPEQTALREEERAWIKWRDGEAARLAKEGGAVGGSAYRVDDSNALLKLIQERTEVLRSRLEKP